MIKQKYSVVIPAAGIGQRMGAECPKQYLPLMGQSILTHSIGLFLTLDCIEQVIIALHPADHWFEALPVAEHPKLVTVEGGVDRVHSVLAALEKVPQEQWVLVHDAARPCLTQNDLLRVIEMAERGKGCILASPVRDTMKRGNLAGQIEQTVSREQLWHAQTPQCFCCGRLKDNIRGALEAGVVVTDEASAMEWANDPVQLIAGRHDNIKITHPEDLPLAEFIMSQQQRSE